MYVRLGAVLTFRLVWTCPPSSSSTRLYAKGVGNLPLSEDLATVIPWWISMLQMHCPGGIYSQDTHPVLVYTGACGAGNVGAAIFPRGKRRAVSTHLPRRLNEGTTICEKEKAVAILGFLRACIVAPGHHVLLCRENEGAVSTLRMGSGQTVLGNQLASVFWAISAAFKCAVWTESVFPDLNAAGPPSRVCAFSHPSLRLVPLTSAIRIILPRFSPIKWRPSNPSTGLRLVVMDLRNHFHAMYRLESRSSILSRQILRNLPSDSMSFSSLLTFGIYRYP